MRYELKKERNKRDISGDYIKENVPGLSKAHYLKLEKQDDVNATTVYLLHQYCGFPLPDEYHKYSIASIRMNCALKDINTVDFFNLFAEKTGISYHWIQRKWREEKYTSLYDYKEILDEILGCIYTPCCIKYDDTVAFYGENDIVFPVKNSIYYYWRLFKHNRLKKEGIVVAKSKESALKKLEEWYMCDVDEFFYLCASTDTIESDIGVVSEGAINLSSAYKYRFDKPLKHREVYTYDIGMIKSNCALYNMKANDFFKEFVKKTDMQMYKIKRKYWGNKEDSSMEEFKEAINEVMGKIYIPCTIEDGGVKPLGKKYVLPVLKNKFYGWNLIDKKSGEIKKRGITVEKTEKGAINKLNNWYVCGEDEQFCISCSTGLLDADIGVF